MEVPEEHLCFMDRARTHPLHLPESITSTLHPADRSVLETYGYLLWALSSQGILPITDSEKRFVSVCQSLQPAETLCEKVWIKWRRRLLFRRHDTTAALCEQEIVEIKNKQSLPWDADLQPFSVDPG
jgi:uncharacterized protein YifE (UPF0438 family)